MVWRASQSGRLDLDDGTLARMLETHESLLVSLVEEFLVEGLQCFEANLDVLSAPSNLVRAVATSCELYTKTLAVLETHLVQASFDVRLVQLFQVLTAAILSNASDILNLFPARHRALVFLLSAFDDFYQGGQGEEAAKEIISMLENRNEDVLIASREGWPLEKRLLLLQFPHVLPHICPSET